MNQTESPWVVFPKFYQNEIGGEGEVFRKKIAEGEAKAGKRAKFLFLGDIRLGPLGESIGPGWF